MSETKFTPAPWAIKHGSQSTEIYAGKEWICEIGSERLRDDANADLIAQAPAMYAAMQEFCDRVDRGEVRSRKTYEQFKSILAAARGEANPQQP